ncbi:MAG TPA: hypothetical protein PKD12_07975 [Nitrospira sp.]|nr:hypothetical protein [Nitrospira sp.]
MSAVESTTTQQVLDEIIRLKSTINSFGEVARTKLKDIEIIEADILKPLLPPTAEQLDDAVWMKLGEKDQNTAYTRLIQVRDSLRSIAGLDGPTDEGHLMYGGYASNFFIFTWLFISFLIAGTLLGTIVYHWEEATASDFTVKLQKADAALKELAEAQRTGTALLTEEVKGASRPALQASANSQNETGVQKIPPAESNGFEKVKTQIATAQDNADKAVKELGQGGASERTVLRMVILLGALGGSLHLVLSLVMYIGNGQLKRRWLPYYLSLPIAGAALAPIVYMLLRVGILTPSGIANSPSGTASLNLVGIYAFSTLTGMFAKTATDKLSEVFSTIFRTAEQPAKDKIGQGKTPNI